MKEPTHNLKRRFENFNGAFWTTHNEHHGWLGSGIFDKNDKEIFEGDVVRYRDKFEGLVTGTVSFKYGCFYFTAGHKFESTVWELGKLIQSYTEVIGHIADGEQHHDA